MAKKKKLLPKTFEELLQAGDLTQLRAVFDTCEIDARGGYYKMPALAFDRCPDDLTCWLVEHGADIGATDTYGDTALHHRARSRRGDVALLLALGADVHCGEGARGTPLHSAARSFNDDSARKLLAHDARVDALDERGFTPLELALSWCRGADISRLAIFAEVLLEAGARKTDRMGDFVTKIGTDFEFHRSGFNPDYLEETSAALERLYVMFSVSPVARRAMHDGESPIVATASGWQERHKELWDLLIPSSGAAKTVQGEVIRISGRISRELWDNGGANWDADFRKMADAWLTHVGSGNALSPTEIKEAGTIVAEVKREHGHTDRMCELAVAWVTLNPKPVPLPPPPPPPYSR